MKTEKLSYQEILNYNDFEYFFRFVKDAHNFKQLWKMKSTARYALKDWLITVNKNPIVSETLSNACSELIENAIKYSLEDTYTFIFSHQSKNMIHIDTINMCTKEQKLYAMNFLDELVANQGNLEQIYVQKIMDVENSNKGQFGLLKILMETKGNIVLLDDEPNVFHIRLEADMNQLADL